MLRRMMLNGVGEGEQLCPRFPLTALSRSPYLPSYSYYSCVSVGGERYVQRHSPARATAFIFHSHKEREGERSTQHSPSRSARQRSPSSGSERGQHCWVLVRRAPLRSGVSSAGVVGQSPDMEENEKLCSSRFDEGRRT